MSVDSGSAPSPGTCFGICTATDHQSRSSYFIGTSALWEEYDYHRDASHHPNLGFPGLLTRCTGEKRGSHDAKKTRPPGKHEKPKSSLTGSSRGPWACLRSSCRTQSQTCARSCPQPPACQGSRGSGRRAHLNTTESYFAYVNNENEPATRKPPLWFMC